MERQAALVVLQAAEIQQPADFRLGIEHQVFVLQDVNPVAEQFLPVREQVSVQAVVATQVFQFMLEALRAGQHLPVNGQAVVQRIAQAMNEACARCLWM